MLELIADVKKIRFAAEQAFVETTKTVEGEARAGHAPQQAEIMDIFMRAFMYLGWAIIQDSTNEDGWRTTSESVIELEN